MERFNRAGQRRPALATAIAAMAMAILAAGCGSTSPTGATASNARQFVSHALAQQVAFAQCMRTHGVPHFPDPTIKSSPLGAGVSQGVSAAVGQSPAFDSAQHACRKLEPSGAQGPSNRPISSAQHAQMVQFAACVRAHGVPNMPDPAANGVFNLPPEINQNAPSFMPAIKGCIPNGMSLSLSQGSS